ncbi:MAG TPA: peptidase M16, partial [Porphyromonadaceae bacterium]|nr:peptidase M16 [Porphyromonadaceae bacterium]
KYARNRYEELPMDIAKGTSETIFQREMENSKASVFNIFSGQSEFTRKNNIIISMLRQIMDIVYTEKIREEEGGTYGVSTSGSIARYPEGQTILQINFDTDPDKA